MKGKRESALTLAFPLSRHVLLSDVTRAWKTRPLPLPLLDARCVIEFDEHVQTCEYLDRIFCTIFQVFCHSCHMTQILRVPYKLETFSFLEKKRILLQWNRNGVSEFLISIKTADIVKMIILLREHQCRYFKRGLVGKKKKWS